MVYSAEISRRNPTVISVLIDQSGSMSEGFGAQKSLKKSQATADILNRFLYDLIIRNTSGESIKDRFYVAVIGYGSTVDSSIAGKSLAQFPVSLTEIANSPLRIEKRKKKVYDGVGSTIEQDIDFPIWVEPISEGGTPMYEALLTCHDILKKWVKSRSTSFPPIVVNITDGMANDERDLEEIAEKIKELQTEDGNTVVFNCHISDKDYQPIMFPSFEEAVSDNYAKLLFRMSSVLPEPMLQAAKKAYTSSPGARGFAFNIPDPIKLTEFLDIGTRTDTADELR